ncbi:MAG: YdcF family protein [Candidatus Omnitrophica bacterium]|nr:YdcF family protein [Candidatus Omnitrophota bacterium]
MSLSDQTFICFSSIDWDFVWQGHQEIMSDLAAKGNRVLFVENTGVRSPKLKDFSRLRSRIRNWARGFGGIRQEQDRLWIYSPLVLPFPYSRLARWINRKLILRNLERFSRAENFHNSILWTFLPTDLVRDISDRLDHKLLVYYCIDKFTESSKEAFERVAEPEKRMLQRADLVFVTSTALGKYCEQYAKEVHKFPFGVHLERFVAQSKQQEKAPSEARELSTTTKVAGYVGGLHQWMDLDLLSEVIEAQPDVRFVFVGPVQTDVSMLKKYPNVRLLGMKPHEELPHYISTFDVGLIPYRRTSYTENVYPTKLNEYLALGVPVVGTNIPELVDFERQAPDLIRVASDAKQFGQYVNAAIQDGDAKLRERRVSAAMQNTWPVRIEKMTELIEKKMQEKQEYDPLRWKARMRRIYLRSRLKVALIAGAFLLAFGIFQSPAAIRWAGAPLVIAGTPQVSDVIVIIGGGVGEGGRPGANTYERARFGAELYAQGFAPAVLLSSGYQYVVKETDEMAAILEQNGVPAQAVRINRQAMNLEDNIRRLAPVLEQSGVESVILVNSGYAMARTRYFVQHYWSGVQVSYVPKTTSLFFDPEVGSRGEQWKALWHEYAGLIYYRLRGFEARNSETVGVQTSRVLIHSSSRSRS